MVKATEWLVLIFTDSDKPPGQRTLGVSVVEVPEGGNVIQGVREAWRRGINPGGSVSAAALEDDLPMEHRNRLLSGAEAEGLGLIVKTPFPQVS